MKRKKGKLFPPLFEKKHFLLNGFLGDIDSRNHAINPSEFGKNQTFIPPPSRNAPNAGTDRIDRIEKCQSGFCNSIIF